MTIAIPISNLQNVYHDNPYTAPKFAIYLINGSKTNITFSLKTIVNNPWMNRGCKFEEDQLKCNCDEQRKNNMRHICDHYALLDLLSGCSYLLANKYCENTARTMDSGKITIFQIPPIIKKIDIAIKNFIIGASIASTLKHIHYES